MSTYRTIDGRDLKYTATPTEAAFLARAQGAAADPAVSHAAMIAMVYGAENPILDTTTLPGRAMVTPAVFARPLYHVFADLIAVKAANLGELDIEKAHAAYTVDVPTAAKELGISAQAVRNAIEDYRLGAIFRKGQYWLRPESLASFRVSKAGRPRKNEVKAAVGGTKGASLSVRIAGGELVTEGKESGATVGRFPVGWTAAAVKTTSEKLGTRVFFIQPADAVGEIEHEGLFVRGAFKIEKKVNETSAAQREWRKFGEAKQAA